MERLREEYRLVCGEGDDDDNDGELMKKNMKKEEDGAMDVEKDDNSKHDDDDATTDEDEKVARLIEELNTAEDELSTAQQMLSRAEIEQTRHEIESELLSSSSSSLVVGLEDLTEAVEAEVADYLQKWQRKFDLCQDEIGRLQEELEEGGVQLVQYYKFRNEERKRLRRQDSSDDDDDDYARRAEMALGEFRNWVLLCGDIIHGFSCAQGRTNSSFHILIPYFYTQTSEMKWRDGTRVSSEELRDTNAPMPRFTN